MEEYDCRLRAEYNNTAIREIMTQITSDLSHYYWDGYKVQLTSLCNKVSTYDSEEIVKSIATMSLSYMNYFIKYIDENYLHSETVAIECDESSSSIQEIDLQYIKTLHRFNTLINSVLNLPRLNTKELKRTIKEHIELADRQYACDEIYFSEPEINSIDIILGGAIC